MQQKNSREEIVKVDSKRTTIQLPNFILDYVEQLVCKIQVLAEIVGCPM